MDFEQIKKATALLRCRAGGKASRGTGFLIAPDLILTCHHVVSIAQGDTKIDVRFPGLQATGTVLTSDSQLDAAVVRLDRAADGIEPLPLAHGVQSKEPFRSVGYPQTTGEDSLPLEGEVRAENWTDASGAESIALYSDQIAGGQGALMQGLSGSPVVVGEYAVGYLRRVLPDPTALSTPRAEFGMVYARPSIVVNKVLPGMPVHRRIPTGATAVSRSRNVQVPSRKSLRKLIEVLMPTAGELDEFMQDHFNDKMKFLAEKPSIHDRVKFLLDIENGAKLLDVLSASFGERYTECAHMLEFEARRR